MLQTHRLSLQYKVMPFQLQAGMSEKQLKLIKQD